MTTRIVVIILLVFLIIIGIALAGYGSFDLIPSGQKDKETAIKALNGEIIPFPVNLSKPFSLMLSQGVSFLFSSEDLAKGINFDTFLWAANITTDQFKVQFANDKLYVSATVRDSIGNPMAQIENNTWKTVDPTYALQFWDRNYNAYAFEIIGSKGKPTLQVIMVGSNEIQIGGLFYTRNGGSIYIAPLKNGDAVIYVNVRPDQHLEDNATLSTIFKYPALTNSSNLGKMVNPYYPSNDPLAEPNSRIQLGNELYVVGTVVVAISTCLLSFPIASIIRTIWKKPERNVRVVIQSDYYLGNKPKKSKKQKVADERSEREEEEKSS